jgi:hypothetical protein
MVGHEHEHDHLDLIIEGARVGATQPVEVEPLGAGKYRVRYSPGFVEGIAAGDIIRVTDPELGRFEVLSRGGNIAVKLAAREAVAGALPAVTAALEAVGGRLDGAIEQAAVWTVPAAAGFKRIEAIMADAVGRLSGSEWWYGNVYDDSGKPLRWWEPGQSQ